MYKKLQDALICASDYNKAYTITNKIINLFSVFLIFHVTCMFLV